MDTEYIIEKFKEKFNSEILEIAEKGQKRVTITIDPNSILKVSDYLFREEGFRFIIATALHTKKGFEIHYHYSKDESGLILNIHVILDK